MVVFLVLNILILLNLLKGKNEKFIFVLFSLIRVFLCVLGTYYSLPFSGSDTVAFNNAAIQQANFYTLSEILGNIDVTKSYFISSITAIFYRVFGEDYSIPIFINGYIGILILYYSIKLFDLVWSPDTRGRLLFLILIGISPILNIHSAIFLRENYITLFVLLASIEFCKYVNSHNNKYAFKFVVFTLFSAFFHGAMIIFVLLLPIYLFLNGKLSISKKIIFIGLFMSLIFFLFYLFDFKKISSVVNSDSAEDMIAILVKKFSPRGNTAYLNNLQINNLIDIVWQVPLRMVNFMLQPFIWNVRSIDHFLVFLDALFWLLIVWKIIFNWRSIFRNKKSLYLLIGMLILICAFSFGTVNFGTAIRHRSKFLVEMLVIVIPFLFNKRFVLKGYVLKHR